MSGLVEAWWKEAQKAGRSLSTYESYRNSMRKVIEFLGHDDAGRVTKADMIAFKDHRLASGVSPKTVKDSDFVGLKTVFKYALENGKLDANPTEGITIVRPRASQNRSKAFTQEEALSILRHASSYHPARNEGAKITAAKRWLPWLCAYTGSRVGELAQLRKQDLRREGTMVVMTITPEAGTVKDKRVRKVVLHKHLLELGFMDFVEKSTPGYLFLKVVKGGDWRGAWRTVKNRMASFVREVVKDVGVGPNHGWRHLFKTIGREVGIEERVLDAIQGHAPGTVGAGYGDVTLATKAKATKDFPRFQAS